jgi:hypothetical protein
MGGNYNQTKVGIGVGRGVDEETRLGQMANHGWGWVVNNEKKAKTRIRCGIKPPLTDTTTNQRLPPPNVVAPPHSFIVVVIVVFFVVAVVIVVVVVWGASTVWLAWHV